MSKSPNSKIKHEYKQFVLESQGKSESSFDAIRYAINLYEEFTNFANFKNFSRQDAIDFKKQLLENKSKTTARRILVNLKESFKWLSYQSGFRKIKITDTEYFNLSLKDDRIAKSNNYKEFSSIDEIRKVIFSMPSATDIEKCNQTLIAFTLLTGIRISALVSLKIKQINLEKELVLQYGKDVDTKFGKTIYTFFFPVGNDVKQVILDWINHLKNQEYTENNPLFPKNKIECKDFSFVCTGLSKEHWQQTTQARQIFKDSFAKAGITC